MNKKRQIIALGKLCGYRVEEHLSDSVYGHCFHVASPSMTGWGNVFLYDEIERAFPNYLEDLNAIHRAENELTDLQHADYRCKLLEVCGSLADALCATAEQRCEAFLRSLNLWEEGLDSEGKAGNVSE